MSTQHDYRAVTADRVLSLQGLVARAGEKDNLAWWDSDALSEAGSFVLRRIFPRSAAWAGIRLAMEAATIRHRAVLGDQKAVSLFCFGESWDTLVRERLDQRYGKTSPPVLRGSIQSSEELLEALREGGYLSGDSWAAPSPLALFESNVFEVGQVRALSQLTLEEVGRLAPRLAASYARGEKRRLVVPYIRILQS